MGIRPDPVMTVSEWADERRVLDQRSSAEPGKWRTSRVPYLKEIMDCLSPSHPCQFVKVRKGIQLGCTQAGMNWLGYIADLAPGPAMLVLPTEGLMKKHSRTKVNPMIQETPVLKAKVHEPKAKGSETTTLFKEFPGGYWMLVGANSSSAFRNVSVRYLMADDVNGYPANVDEEGDPLSLAIGRTDSFSNRKILIISTPTVKNASRISLEYEESDQRLFFLPCPFCGHYQDLRWGNIKFKHTDCRIDGEVTYECEACRKLISERYKTQMLAAGKWIAQNPGHPDPGFHISGLYAPAGWAGSWRTIATEFLQANKSREKELFKSWTNKRLAEDWEEKGESVDGNALMLRLEPFKKTVPAGACLLTCAADIQKDRIEAEMVAWGPGEESWSMEHRIFEGDTDTIKSKAWNDLDNYLAQTWKHESGVEMSIGCTFIDSGDNTDTVYKWVKPRQRRRIFASKGSSNQGQPIVTRPSRNTKVPVKLFMIGVDQAKEKILSRLKIETAGPGYMHFPEGRSKEYFDQLSSEVLKTRFERGKLKREWVKIRTRNEALDLKVLNLAARTLLGWDLEKLMEQFQNKIEKFKKSEVLPSEKNKEQETGEPGEKKEPEPPKRIVLKKTQRRGGWSTNW